VIGQKCALEGAAEHAFEIQGAQVFDYLCAADFSGVPLDRHFEREYSVEEL